MLLMIFLQCFHAKSMIYLRLILDVCVSLHFFLYDNVCIHVQRGWSGGAAFRDIISSSVLLGLKFTNQLCDQE